VALVKKIFFGEESSFVKEQKLKDLNSREISILAVLIIMVFWMGIYPKFFLDYTKTSVEHLVINKSQYTLDIKTVTRD